MKEQKHKTLPVLSLTSKQIEKMGFDGVNDCLGLEEASKIMDDVVSGLKRQACRETIEYMLKEFKRLHYARMEDQNTGFNDAIKTAEEYLKTL